MRRCKLGHRPSCRGSGESLSRVAIGGPGRVGEGLPTDMRKNKVETGRADPRAAPLADVLSLSLSARTVGELRGPQKMRNARREGHTRTTEARAWEPLSAALLLLGVFRGRGTTKTPQPRKARAKPSTPECSPRNVVGRVARARRAHSTTAGGIVRFCERARRLVISFPRVVWCGKKPLPRLCKSRHQGRPKVIANCVRGLFFVVV